MSEYFQNIELFWHSKKIILEKYKSILAIDTSILAKFKSILEKVY
jgi:hypothetical protein